MHSDQPCGGENCVQKLWGARVGQRRLLVGHGLWDVGIEGGKMPPLLAETRRGQPEVLRSLLQDDVFIKRGQGKFQADRFNDDDFLWVFNDFREPVGSPPMNRKAGTVLLCHDVFFQGRKRDVVAEFLPLIQAVSAL